MHACPQVGRAGTPSLKSFESLRLGMGKSSVSSFAVVYLFLILLLVTEVTNNWLAFETSDSKLHTGQSTGRSWYWF